MYEPVLLNYLNKCLEVIIRLACQEVVSLLHTPDVHNSSTETLFLLLQNIYLITTLIFSHVLLPT